MIWYFLMLLSCIHLFVSEGCNVTNTAETGSSKYVKGFVLDSLTNLPIDSAKIFLGSKPDSSFSLFETYTNSNGQYLFFLGNGTNGSGLLVVAEKGGYQKQKKSFSTALLDTATVNFKLSPIR
jgi:hypothetical protein